MQQRSPRPLLRTLLLALPVTASLAVTGCQAETGGVETTSFAEQIANALDEAGSGGAAENQLAALQEAKETGRVTFDQARTAIFATVDCVEAGGGSASYVEEPEASGLLVPTFVVEAEDDTALDRLGPLIEECGIRESFWVNKVYQLQPASQEVRDAHLETVAPEIRTCLEDNGVATDADASAQELLNRALEVSYETDNTINCTI